MMNSPGKMVVFLSTQDSVEFHYKLMNHFFGGEETEDNANLAEEGDIDFFKLHGDMPQKAGIFSGYFLKEKKISAK